MTFQSPIWILVAAIAVPLCVVFYSLTEIKYKKRLIKFHGDSKRQLFSSNCCPVKHKIKATLFTLTFILCCLALSQPQLGSTYIEEKRRGVDFMIALDVSKSMLAEDITPNRLERAKLAILDLLEETKGDRVGLVAFAGSAFLQCPLTLDYDAFRQTLLSVNTDILSNQGTDIAGALIEAEASFAKDSNHKVLIMMTDGEDLEAEGVMQAKIAKQSGLTIYTIGVGLPEGELIPFKDDQGRQNWLKDPNGNLIRTQLDENTLKQIAIASNGIYAPLGSTGEGLQLIYNHCIKAIPPEERESRMQKVPIDRYQWPLALAIGCSLIQSFIGNRRSNQVYPNILVFVFLAGVLFPHQNAFAFTNSKGKKLFLKGDYEEASNFYEKQIQEKPAQSIFYYNLGIANLRDQNYDKATSALSKALELAVDNPDFQSEIYEAKAILNLEQGENLKTSYPEKSIDLWRSSSLDFKNAQNLESSKNTIRLERLENYQSLVHSKLTDLIYKEGIRKYRERNYSGATESFEDSLYLSPEEQLDEINYNLGNCGYKKGELLLNENPKSTIETWEKAIKRYDEAIERRRDSEFTQATKNRDLLIKRLHELKQQLKNQESKTKDKNSDNDKEEQQDKTNGGKPEHDKSGSETQTKTQHNKDPKLGEENNPQNPKEESATDSDKRSKFSDKSLEYKQELSGKMTKEQAIQLLEQLRTYERKLPLGNLEKIRKSENSDNRMGRNW